MGFLHADRVKETTATTGLGTYDLAGAAAGFRTFVAGVGTGNRCVYCVENGTDWEINEGVVTDAAPDTLTRARLLASSTGSAINWGAGTKNIFAVYSAADQNPRTRALTADHTNSTTTGTEVTGLELADVQPGTYVVRYLLLSQAPATTTGLLLGVNFTGTAVAQAFLLGFAGSGAAASTGIIDESTDTDQIMEGYAKNAFSTTAPNLGIGIVGRITANQDALLVIEAVIVVTVAGNLELWHASEVAAESRLQAGSSVILTRTN